MSAAGRDQHLAHRDALDVHPEDRLGDRSASSVAGGQLDAAGLAATTDEHLGLDDDRGRPAGEEPPAARPGLRNRVSDLPGGHGQALREEQRFGVRFLDLQGMAGLRWVTTGRRGS